MIKQKEESFLEGWAKRLSKEMRRNAAPLLSGLIAGLLAYTYAFTNKLVNADELVSLFGKGGTVTSGRWGLKLTSLLFPDVSMPWLYGVIAILLFSAAACLALNIFQIRSRMIGCALAAVIVCFPAVTGLFCYMFTAAPYALAFLLAVISVRLAQRGGRLGWLFSCGCLVLSMGIYQAYIAVASSFFLLLMIKRLLQNDGSAREVFKFGLRCAALLAVSLVIYGGISVLAVIGESFLDYGVNVSDSLLRRIRLAYSGFIRIFISGYFAYVPSKLSMLMHFIGVFVTVFSLGGWFVRNRDKAKGLLMLLCLVLLPLSIDCMYLAADLGIIHSLVLHGFITVYFLAAVAVESVKGRPGAWSRDALLISLLCVAAVNVVFANEVSLKMHLQYENAYSFYTGIITQVRMTEGYDEDTVLAVLGDSAALSETQEKIDVGRLMGPNQNLVNIYSRDCFLEEYIGYGGQLADASERNSLMKDPRVLQMPNYPYEGSIQKIDDYIVVKLG